LIFWDIDGTLLTTGKQGPAALLEAARRLAGAPARDFVDMRGRTEYSIWRSLCAQLPRLVHSGYAAFKAEYVKVLSATMNASSSVALPGAKELCGVLQRARIRQAVLTGNSREAARSKLRAAGFTDFLAELTDPSWACFGDADDKGGAELEAACSRLSAEERRRSIVIGDAEQDVDCARRSGLSCLAVAAGGHSLAELIAAGPTWHVSSLANVPQIARLLMTEVGHVA
jgi:phosphoglycolate phosphatase